MELNGEPVLVIYCSIMNNPETQGQNNRPPPTVLHESVSLFGGPAALCSATGV